MEVELHSDLLSAHQRSDLPLLALCALGLSGRHRVFPAPDKRKLWDQWAQNLCAPGASELTDEVIQAWDSGEYRASVGSACDRIVVVPNGSSFSGSPLKLSPLEALTLLGRPLRVLLENGRNDRAFLLAFAEDPHRKAIEDAESQGWLSFETAGGIGELKVRLADAQAAPEREVMRVMFLCDSDAQEPGQPSDDARLIAQRLASLTRKLRLPDGSLGLVLSRRAAENYAPAQAILAWATKNHGQKNASTIILSLPNLRTRYTAGPGSEGSTLRQLLAALALKELRESPDLLGHLDLKRGQTHSSQSLWSRLDAFQQAALNDGFGSNFSASFFQTQSRLPDPTGEIVGLISTILRRL